MSVYCDSKTVAAAGTPEALTTRDIRCRAVVITAKKTNTGLVYVVDMDTPSKKSPPLNPEDSVTLPIETPKIVKIDVSVNGEGVDWMAV